MKKLLLLLFLSGCTTNTQWEFQSKDIEAINFRKVMKAGQYSLYKCSSFKADGHLVVKGEYQSGNIYFCLRQQMEKRNGSLLIDKQENNICVWRETGVCNEDGLCESYSLLDDCAKINS